MLDARDGENVSIKGWLLAGLAIAIAIAALIVFFNRKNTTDPILRDEFCLKYETEIMLVPQYTTVCAGGSCRSQFSHFLPVVVESCVKKTYIEYPNPDYIEPEKKA